MEPEWWSMPDVTQDPVEGEEGIDWDWEGVMNENNTAFVGKRRRPRV